jgi:hypothetical protein
MKMYPLEVKTNHNGDVLLHQYSTDIYGNIDDQEENTSSIVISQDQLGGLIRFLSELEAQNPLV